MFKGDQLRAETGLIVHARLLVEVCTLLADLGASRVGSGGNMAKMRRFVTFYGLGGTFLSSISCQDSIQLQFLECADPTPNASQPEF